MKQGVAVQYVGIWVLTLNGMFCSHRASYNMFKDQSPLKNLQRDQSMPLKFLCGFCCAIMLELALQPHIKHAMHCRMLNLARVAHNSFVLLERRGQYLSYSAELVP